MADKPDDFIITIENVLDDEPYMMAEIMERISNPNIRLCFDTGHALCVSKVPVSEWLRVLAPYLRHLHIHNNDGQYDHHSALTEGLIDMEDFLDDVIKLCSRDTTVTLETMDGLGSVEWLGKKGYLV